MSWYYEPWTSSDDILDGLPRVVAPPEKYNIDGAVTVWNWTDDILDGLPYVVEAPAFGINNIYFGKIQPNDFYYGKNQVKQIYCGKKLVYSNE